MMHHRLVPLSFRSRSSRRHLSRPNARADRMHKRKVPRLEHGMLEIFGNLFTIEARDLQAETGDSRRPRAQVRRQQSGTQYGADIVIRFRGAAIRASSTCLVECKNYAATGSGLTMSTVADKVLQAEANFDAEPVDHWILVSPSLDPNNELDRTVERWNAEQRFPFTVQIWSPQTGVRDLFSHQSRRLPQSVRRRPSPVTARRSGYPRGILRSGSARRSGCQSGCGDMCSIRTRSWSQASGHG